MIPTQKCFSKNASVSTEANLQILKDGRVKLHDNPVLGYFNINSNRNAKCNGNGVYQTV